MSAHTPGPWELNVNERDDDPYDYIKHGGLTVAAVRSYASGTTADYPSKVATQEAAANVRLMAAAPDLAAELKWAISIIELNAERIGYAKNSPLDRHLRQAAKVLKQAVGDV